MKLPPPQGDETRAPGILATTILVSCLSSVVVALRMGTRIWIVRSVGWDDYTILCAVIGVIIGTALVVVQIHYGFGRHKLYLTKWEYIELEKYSYGEWIQTFQTLMFTKISICFFLLRIPVKKYFIRPIQVAIVALVISNIILTLLWIFQCNPIASAWNKDTPGTCFSDAQLQRIIISQAIISIISDFMLALFPIVLLWKVQIALRVKIGLCALMGLGLITAAFCIVRTVLNWQNINADPPWESVTNWYWRSWEICFGVWAACIPALRPGYKTITAGIASYRSQRSSRKISDTALQPNKESSEVYRGADYTAYEAAAETVRHEADRAQVLGAGEQDFAMKRLAGDRTTANRGDEQVPQNGIIKTTNIDVSGLSSHTSQGSTRSLEMEDAEKGLRNTDFF